MDWVSKNWPQLTSAAVGLLFFGAGLLDIETTGRLGIDRDWNLILMGGTALGATALPLIQHAAGALRR